MQTQQTYIEYKEFNLLGNLSDEESALTNFETYSDSDSYVCDVIMEIGDNFTPIYYNDIWENVRDIREHIEEAIAQGLTEGTTDLERIFQMGYYQFYTQSLYDNLDIMVFNMVAQKVNDFLNENSDEYIGNVDTDLILEDIENKVQHFDNNHKMGVITNIALEVIQDIKDGKHNL